MREVISFINPADRTAQQPKSFLGKKASFMSQRMLRPTRPPRRAGQQMATATVVIDGEAIIGFNRNRARIEKLLGQAA
jgi:hypothetical protein